MYFDYSCRLDRFELKMEIAQARSSVDKTIAHLITFRPVISEVKDEYNLLCVRSVRAILRKKDIKYSGVTES